MSWGMRRWRREAYEAVVQEFGREILTGEGAIDRRALAARVFGDPVRLAQLNALVHPVVFRRGRRVDRCFCGTGSKRDRSGGSRYPDRNQELSRWIN